MQVCILRGPFAGLTGKVLSTAGELTKIKVNRRKNTIIYLRDDNFISQDSLVAALLADDKQAGELFNRWQDTIVRPEVYVKPEIPRAPSHTTQSHADILAEVQANYVPAAPVETRVIDKKIIQSSKTGRIVGVLLYLAGDIELYFGTNGRVVVNYNWKFPRVYSSGSKIYDWEVQLKYSGPTFEYKNIVKFATDYKTKFAGYVLECWLKCKPVLAR